MTRDEQVIVNLSGEIGAAIFDAPAGGDDRSNIERLIHRDFDDATDFLDPMRERARELLDTPTGRRAISDLAAELLTRLAPRNANVWIPYREAVAIIDDALG